MTAFYKKDLALACGFALLYFLSARLGLLLSLVGNSVTLFWPPSGIALTALLAFGIRLWPGVFAGSVLGNLAAGLVPALEISIGSTLEAVIGAYLLRRHIPFNLSLVSVRDIFALLLVASCAALLSALNGPFWLALNGLMPWDKYPSSALYWWMGDTLGVILFTPLLLSWLRHKPKPRTTAVLREEAAYFSILFLLCLLVFSNVSGKLLDTQIGPFVLLPVLVWGALRFNMRTTVLGSVIVFFSSMVGMVWEVGAFAPVSEPSIRQVWIYNLTLGVTCLVLVVYNYQRERTSKFLELSESNLRHAQSVAAIGSWNLDISANQLRWSDESYRIFGMVPGTPMTLESFVAGVHPQDREAVLKAWERATQGEEPYDIEHRILVHGQTRWVRERAEIKFNTAGHAVSASGTMQDVTERKEAEESIRFLAYYDVLTGLPNRTLLYDRIGQMLISAQRDGDRFAVLFLDLDRFKYINDSMGHMVGDKLLQVVAERLRASVRETDTISRLGGDEFIILLRDADLDGAAHIAEKILTAVATPFDIDGVTVTPQGSIGISLFPEDGADVSTLIKHADAAMYHAKDLGRNNFQFFTAQMNQRAQFHFDMEKDLRLALERNEFQLYYQPQISLGDGRLTGLEALLRWRHPQRGMVAPSEFIPIAEESGLIVPIGAWVLQTACTQARAWRAQGLAEVPVAVNLSIRQLRDHNLISQIAALLQQDGLPGCQLELELTESIMLKDAAAAMKFIAEARQMGVLFSIDDFGTGYSSLGYLKKLSLDKLKIDQSFVHDIHAEPEDSSIVRSIITLAHGLNLRVIAEGVETAEQMEFLRAAGCDEVQGYYINHPKPAAELDGFIRQRGASATPVGDTSSAGAEYDNVPA